MSHAIQLFAGTVLMGDPTSLPFLKAATTFSDSNIVFGKDPHSGNDGTTAFYVAIKNIVLDSTSVNPSSSITLLDWTVSQATQLTNVIFNMPDFSSGHTGIGLVTGSSGYNSNIILNDLIFNGGATGLNLSINGQQWILKGMTFNRCHTGLKGGGMNLVVSNSTFVNCTTGIDASSVGGSFTCLDSVGYNLGTFVSSYDSPTPSNSLILENIENNGNTVVLNNKPVVTGNIPNTWVHGNVVGRMTTCTTLNN